MEKKNEIGDGGRFERNQFYFLCFIAITCVIVGVIFPTQYSSMIITTGIILLLIIYLMNVFRTITTTTNSKTAFVALVFALLVFLVSIVFILCLNGVITAQDFMGIINKIVSWVVDRGHKM